MNCAWNKMAFNVHSFCKNKLKIKTKFHLGLKGFSDFVHRLDSNELEDKNTTFRILDLFPSSGEGRHLLCWVP
jgi:hypothetical protein